MHTQPVCDQLVRSIPIPLHRIVFSRYDDVSADDLINYIQSAIGRAATAAPAIDVDQSSPLRDAEPFEYSDDSPIGDDGMPGTMPQLRQYGPGGTPMTDIDFEAHHGNPNPHAHDWDGTTRDQGAPVSILPW